MTDVTEVPEEEVAKASKLPLIVGVVLALLGGAGGYFATSSGMIPLADTAEEEHPPEIAMSNSAPTEFVPIQPMVVNLAGSSPAKHLKIAAQLEVPAQYRADVEHLMPRIVDVLITYLRAIEAEQVDRPAALIRLRSHMLHRVNVVVGRGRVNDLLIMEFVIN